MQNCNNGGKSFLRLKTVVWKNHKNRENTVKRFRTYYCHFYSRVDALNYILDPRKKCGFIDSFISLFEAKLGPHGPKVLSLRNTLNSLVILSLASSNDYYHPTLSTGNNFTFIQIKLLNSQDRLFKKMWLHNFTWIIVEKVMRRGTLLGLLR